MLTAKEKRFIRYWEEQRTGGKGSYLTLYILAGTFIATIIVFFILAMFGIDFDQKIWLIPTVSAVIVIVASTLTWKVNEKKFKQIIKREIELGMEKGESNTNGQPA